MTRVVIVVGEASGDLLGAGLIESLRSRDPDIQVEGVTGPLMRAAGCDSWADYEPLAVMGLFEVIRHLPGLRLFMRMLERRLEENPPDILIGVDAPDFNLRLLKRARGMGIKTVQYVCPSVWAWRTSRVKNIAAACDHVLCLLPFEVSFLSQHSIAADFIGHPLADAIQPELESISAGHLARPVVAVLPGSRLGEIKYLGSAFVAAMSWLKQRRPDIQFVTGAANPRTAAAFRELYVRAGLEHDVVEHDGGARSAMQSADVVLVTSGTVTLEAMLLLRPMIVAYKVSFITAWLLRLSGLVKIDRFALPNLLANANLVPELIQEHANGPELGDAVLGLIDAPAKRAEQQQEFDALGNILRLSANESAAQVILNLLGQAKSV